ncbi:hypothetical protein [Oryza sativa Japonica Group]|uniref:Uncharacterized protein n=1 Tax=Oryza sativa subsp. japonica TaxID=39947 RepID=Q9ARP5_ORYSJ|nr:hypothetical protein [Oryza sativa Japonica Group]BAB89429.1 hypothetical protein [Oryza sativa Japonica Group]
MPTVRKSLPMCALHAYLATRGELNGAQLRGVVGGERGTTSAASALVNRRPPPSAASHFPAPPSAFHLPRRCTTMRHASAVVGNNVIDGKEGKGKRRKHKEEWEREEEE